MFKKIKIFLLFFLTLTLSACGAPKARKVDNRDIGGVLKSFDSGLTWKQKNAVLTVNGKKASLVSTSMALLEMDPSDHKTLYYAPIGLGLYYSYDGGDSWQKAKGVPRATVRSIAVDPVDKNIVYLSIGNKVYKTSDSNRSWQRIYFDDNTRVTVDAVGVSRANHNHIFISLSRGDLLKSEDGGQTWKTVHRFKQKITKIIMDPNNDQIIYLKVPKKAFYKSEDGGKTWHEWNAMLKKHGLSFAVKTFLLFKGDPKTIFLASPYGIIRTFDNGETWEKLKLIPPDRGAGINSLAVDPTDYKKIFYITKKTLYYSSDGGETWTPKQLPTSRIALKIMIDPLEPKIMYLGSKKIIKK